MKAVILAGVFRFIPNGTYFGMDTLITTLLEQRHELVRYLIEAYWLDIGQVEDYESREYRNTP